MRVTRRELASLVRRYTLTVVAEWVKVKPATVRRWLKTGVPKARVAAVASVRSIRPPTKRDTKTALKMSPATLANLAGVTLRTAKGWIRKGAIPTKYQAFLQDRAPEVKPRRLLGTMRLFDGQFTRGSGTTIQLGGAIVTNSLIADIMAWSNTAQTTRYLPSSTTYQYVFEGSTEFAEKDTFRGSAVSIKLKRKRGKVKGIVKVEFVRIATHAWDKREDAIAELLENLQDIMRFTFKIDSVTLWVRRTIGGDE